MRLLLLVAAGLIFSSIATAAEPTDLIGHFVPQDVLAADSTVSTDAQARSCEADLPLRLELAGLTPQVRLEGLSSQMLSTENVLQTLDTFAADTSAVMTSALVRDDDADKNFLMALLAHWADADAYAQTRDCSVNGETTCGGEWHTPRGTELAPIKDYQTTEERLVPVAFAYNLILRDYKRDELADEHAKIEKWLGVFLQRLPDTGRSTRAPVYFGFGNNWQNWGYPLTDLLAGNEQNFKARLANLATKLDKIVLPDGSLDQRTTRGARALWYHMTGLNETMFALELERANGVDLYPQFKDRLDKAAGIFLDGVDDIAAGNNTIAHPARIYKWARGDFHSADDPRVQIFSPDDDNGYGADASWMYIYLYRFPDSPLSDRLRALIATYHHLPRSDQSTGINVGCLYRLAIPQLAQREASEHPPISDAQITSLISKIGAPPPVIGKLALAYTSAEFFDEGGRDNGKSFAVTLDGVSLGGKALGTIRFGILTDFKDSSLSPKSLDLFRLTIGYSQLDPQTDISAFTACGGLASNDGTVRLHYGAEAQHNECIFTDLGPADRDLWASVFSAFPKILTDNAKDPTAAELEKLIAVKLKER